MQRVEANVAVRVRDLKKSPSAVMQQAQVETVAVYTNYEWLFTGQSASPCSANREAVSATFAKSDSRCAIVTSKMTRAESGAEGMSNPRTQSPTTVILKPRSDPALTVVLTQKPATARVTTRS